MQIRVFFKRNKIFFFFPFLVIVESAEKRKTICKEMVIVVELL